MNKQPLTKPKAIIMGVDQIVTNVNPWFEFLSELRIDWEKEQQMYHLLRDGKVNWKEIKTQMIPIPKGEQERVHKSRFEKTVANININSDAVATVRELQEKGYIVAIISGSIDLIVKSIAERLKIVDWYANSTLYFDDSGYWTDIEFLQDESNLKLNQAQDFMNKYNLKPEEVLVIGHSQADVKLFQKFSAVAIGKEVNPVLDGLAWEKIEYLPRILQILKRFE